MSALVILVGAPKKTISEFRKTLKGHPVKVSATDSETLLSKWAGLMDSSQDAVIIDWTREPLLKQMCRWVLSPNQRFLTAA